MLLIDNCAANQIVQNLKTIDVEFLPSNTIQPMGMDVIRNYKSHYRQELVNLTLYHIELGLLAPESTATSVSSKTTFLDAIQFLNKSWRLVRGSTIQGC